MGQIFARTVLGLDRPVVGLLNVGSEEQKGHEAIREAATLLRGIKGMPFDFHGFVEGDDIPAGTVDVVVTDGFSGNVALKTAERSEEHTSELQSLMRISYAVFCLKKKKNNIVIYPILNPT